MKTHLKVLSRLLTALGSLSFASLASASGVATITYGPGATSVPTMGGTMLIALAVLLALVAFRLLQDRRHAGSNMVIAIATVTALATGAGGIKLISDAHADNAPLTMSDGKGGTILVPNPGSWIISNATDVPQSIKAIDYMPGCGPGKPGLQQEAVVVNGAAPINSCTTATTLAPGAAENCEITVFCDG